MSRAQSVGRRVSGPPPVPGRVREHAADPSACARGAAAHPAMRDGRDAADGAPDRRWITGGRLR